MKKDATSASLPKDQVERCREIGGKLPGKASGAWVIENLLSACFAYIDATDPKDPALNLPFIQEIRRAYGRPAIHVPEGPAHVAQLNEALQHLNAMIDSMGHRIRALEAQRGLHVLPEEQSSRVAEDTPKLPPIKTPKAKPPQKS